MADVITMLALSPTMEEGTLVEWLKAEGDTVAEGELIAEIETDKATMEMESFHDGTILKLLVKKGDAIPVGAPLAIIGEAGEDISSVLEGLNGGGGAAKPAAEAKTEAKEKTEEAPNETAKQTAAPKADAPPKREAGERIFASPLARKIADDRGLDLSQIDGSGPNGRIVKADVEDAQPRTAEARKDAPTPAAPAGEGEKVALSQMRKTIAKRLTQVWVETPHFFLTIDIDMAAAMAERKRINDQLAAAEVDVKISVNDLIVKACAVALQRCPDVNVSFQGDHLLQYDGSHIGVAVAVDGGLITPTVFNAHQKSLSTIATEVRELAGRARDKKLKPEEYTGGTFSISNLGMYGIEHFTAIINPPQAAILACGAVKKEPVVNAHGELTVGTRMKVTMSCDHRAVDGATGSEFLIEVKKLLENPLLLLV